MLDRRSAHPRSMHIGSLPLEYQPGRSHLGGDPRPNTPSDRGISRRSVLGAAPALLAFAGGVAASGCT